MWNFYILLYFMYTSVYSLFSVFTILNEKKKTNCKNSVALLCNSRTIINIPLCVVILKYRMTVINGQIANHDSCFYISR